MCSSLTCTKPVVLILCHLQNRPAAYQNVVGTNRKISTSVVKHVRFSRTRRTQHRSNRLEDYYHESNFGMPPLGIRYKLSRARAPSQMVENMYWELCIVHVTCHVILQHKKSTTSSFRWELTIRNFEPKSLPRAVRQSWRQKGTKQSPLVPLVCPSTVAPQLALTVWWFMQHGLPWFRDPVPDHPVVC